VIPDS